MKFKSILNLSIKNIFLKKSAYLKVVAGFFFAFLIIFIVVFYSGSLSTAYDDYIDVKAGDLVYMVRAELTAEQYEEIRAFPQVKSVYSYSNTYFSYGTETDITIGGSGYHIGEEEYSLSVRYVAKYEGQNSDYAFCENEVTEFTAETGEQPLSYGETLKSAGDILIYEPVLKHLKIEERNELIGKQISVEGFRTKYVDGEQQVLPFSVSGKICGIVNSNFGGDDFVLFANEDTLVVRNEISLNTFTGNEDFFARMDEMFGDESSHYFYGQYDLSRMKTVEGQQTLCNRFLSIIGGTLLAVICVYVASNQYYLLQKNSTFYGILKANGVDNKSVFLTHALELAITLVVALILAFAVGVGVFFIMRLLFDDFLGIDLLFPAGVAVGSFFGFLALCVSLAVLITLFIYVKILKKQPVHLLKK